MRESERAHRAQLNMLDDLLLVLPPKLLIALAAHAKELDRLALRDERIRPFARQPHDCRVERPAQAAFRRADEEKMRAVAPGAGQQPRRGAEIADGARDIA